MQPSPTGLTRAPVGVQILEFIAPDLRVRVAPIGVFNASPAD